METQPLAPGVPYDPGRRQVFGQMDNQAVLPRVEEVARLPGGGGCCKRPHGPRGGRRGPE